MSLILPPSNLNLRTTLLMGETGSGKTTQLALIAKWLFKKYGIKTRLIEAEGGGTIQFDDEDLIETGIVQRFNLGAVNDKIRYLARLSKGYWPDAEGIIRADSNYLYGLQDYSCYMFDSISGISEMLGEHASTPDSNIAFKLGTVSSESDDGDTYKFGTMSEAHYQVVHKEIRKAFHFNFKAIPSLRYLFVTARIMQGADRMKTKSYFPSTIGQKLSPEVPSWFQDFIHLDSASVTGEQVSRHLKVSVPEDKLQAIGNFKVAWFTEHKDENTLIKYPCKARIGPSLVEQVNSDRFKEGFVILDTSLGLNRFYEYLKTLKRNTNKEDELALGETQNA